MRWWPIPACSPRPGRGLACSVIQLARPDVLLHQQPRLLSTSWHRMRRSIADKTNVIVDAFAKQFNFVATQKIRRSVKGFDLYSTLYGKHSFRKIVSDIGRSMLGRAKGTPVPVLLGASLFCWESQRIPRESVHNAVSDMDIILAGHTQEREKHLGTWSVLIDKPGAMVWRRSVPDTALYEYKVHGTLTDVSAREFFYVQTDLDFRKAWDNLVVELEVVDRDNETGSEVVHWVTRYPFPMYSRQYVFVRRYDVDHLNNVMVVQNRSTEHPRIPNSRKYVRVNRYNSTMVIRPHRSFDEDGLDYILTYCDDPQSPIPSAAYNWVASTGFSEYVSKLHGVALQLKKNRNNNNDALGEAVGM